KGLHCAMCSIVVAVNIMARATYDDDSDDDNSLFIRVSAFQPSISNFCTPTIIPHVPMDEKTPRSNLKSKQEKKNNAAPILTFSHSSLCCPSPLLFSTFLQCLRIMK